MRQFALDLPSRPPALGRGDFLASGCNQAALCWIERWPDWPSFALVLHGPEGSGKSHLAQLWRARSGAVLLSGSTLAQQRPDALADHRAVAVDDADQAPERDLLHLHTCCAERSASLLVVARHAPAVWPMALPDLASRLRASPCTAIGAPDEALLAAILVKHFADRQLRVAPSVIAYLVRRMERSFAAATTLAARLDTLALGLGRPITLALARRVLAEFGDGG